jgi:MerR family transcriptional regulator, light-induced transcriptional regulator
MHRNIHPNPQDPAPPDNPDLLQRRFVSQLLTSSAEEIATKATGLLLQRWADISTRFRPHARERWTEHFSARITDLASALITGRPEAFVDQVRWSRVAFEARGVPTDDLQRSIDVLGEVLEHFVPLEDQPLIEQYIDPAGIALYEPVRVTPTRLSVNTPHGELAARYLLASLEGDRLEASTLILDAVRGGMLTVPEAYSNILEPVQHELGRMWHLNDLSIPEEHFATQTTLMVISQLYPFLIRAPRNGRTMLAASVQGNAHEIGVRIVADYFEIAGWRVVYLGANVPSDDLATAVTHFSSDVICLSATMLAHVRAVEQAIAACRSSPQTSRVKILVGGSVFDPSSDLWREVGADATASCPLDAVRSAHRLLGMPAPTVQ